MIFIEENYNESIAAIAAMKMEKGINPPATETEAGAPFGGTPGTPPVGAGTTSPHEGEIF